ncbi:MAG: cytochrome c oxidase subunit II transmembrane domain-containing protein [Dehalococcoidales bacterium]
MEPRRRLADWHHMLIMCLVMAVLSGGLVYLFLHVNFIPNPASQERAIIDNFIQILFAIASVFFVVVVTIFVYALIFFRRPKGDNTDARPIRGNAPLELLWTIIPLIIVVVLGVYGAHVLDEISVSDMEHGSMQSVYSLGATVPGQLSAANTTQYDLVINVTASRFAWQFEYPDYGITSYVLEVPEYSRIMFNIQSKDVIHSFWVQQWGPKQDAVPGLSPMMRITPTELGQFLVQCSQLCGYDHTDMTAPVKVVSGADFYQWVVQQQAASANVTPLSGQQIVLDLIAQNLAFDKSTITVPAGAAVMINFTNKDNGMPHNFAVYTDSTATKAIFVGQIVTGPGTTMYMFNAPTKPGTYFFRCDVHPTIMTGSFVVQ